MAEAYGTEFIVGENVSLRTVEKGDIEFLSKAYNHPEVLPNLTWSKPSNKEQKQELFEEEISDDSRVDLMISVEKEAAGRIVLLEKDEGVAEIGIWLLPEHQGNGYGTEACRLIIDYAFQELRYQKIFARVYESNKPSQKMFEKLGFQKEGDLRNQIYRNGDFENAYIYGLLKEEWS